MKEMRWLALCAALLISGMSFTGCNGKEENSAADIVTETMESVESTEAETETLVPNAESDFLWHALTAEEVGDSQYVGGVVITGYVGDSDDVVIPKAIDNKPVVAIAEFAFSPYRYDDFRYYGEFEGGFSKQTYPFVKLLENTGILDEYETIFQKMNADENIQEAYLDNRFSAYIRYLLEGEENVEKLPTEVFNQFESWCQSYTPEQLHFFNGYKEYADEGSSVAVFLLDITNDLRSDDDEGYLDIIRADVIESMKDYEYVSDLKRVMLPNTIALIGGGAFAYCDSLEKVCIYDTKEGEIPFIDDAVWTDVEGAQNYRFLEGHQFTACTNLKETNFYLDVDDCGSQCYQFCINLETVYIAPAESGALTMAYCVPDSQNLKHVYVSEACQSISAAVSYKLYDTSACTFYLPSSVTEIGEEVFCQHNNKSGDYYKEGGPEETPCEFNGVEIITPEGSYAEQYAKEHGIKVNGVLHEVVQPTEAPTEPTTEAATDAQDDDRETITGTIITEEDALNVRMGPSTEYAKLGTVPKGATVYITGENGDWYIIEYGTDIGYILKNYVSLD